MLFVLRNADTQLRKQIIKNAPEEIIKTLSEIAYNLLNGNIKISTKIKKKLKQYKRTIRTIACPYRQNHSKRKILINKNHIVPELIASILTGEIGKILQQ